MIIFKLPEAGSWVKWNVFESYSPDEIEQMCHFEQWI